MAEMADSMIHGCHLGLMDRSRHVVTEVFEIEEAVDGLKREIQAYLDRIHGDALSNKEERRLHVLHHVAGDIERIGDQAVNIAQRVLILLRENYILSESACRDMNDLFEKTTSLYNRAVESLREENRESARQALALEEDVDRLEREYKANHVSRLERGDCNPTAGILYVEILHNLERMGDHAVNIAGDVLYAI